MKYKSDDYKLSAVRYYQQNNHNLNDLNITYNYIEWSKKKNHQMVL